MAKQIVFKAIIFIRQSTINGKTNCGIDKRFQKVNEDC